MGRWTGGRLVNFRSLCARAEPLLGRIGAVLDARQVVATLSASQRQLVMLARALAPSPVVLILDEPTSALTQAETNNLFGIVRSLRGEGGSIVFISHKLEEVFALADRATVLRDGAVIAEFERSQFTADDIITAMVGRHMERRFPPRETAIGTEEVLRVRDLTIPHPHLANRNVVEGLNFALRRGEILGLAGLVGSGRSETLNALYGMVPCRGRIVVEGKPVRISTPRHAKAAGIGLMTEDRKRNGLLFNLGIRANITINSLGAVSRFGVVRPALENKTARGYFDQMSIAAPSLETAVGALSGGNQQKVLLAKVLGSQPKALLLDEPTKGVDVGAKFEIYKMMRRLAGAGVGIIFVSSELPELIAMSDRVIVLANRRLVCELPQLRLDQEQIMLAATGGDPGGAVPARLEPEIGRLWKGLCAFCIWKMSRTFASWSRPCWRRTNWPPTQFWSGTWRSSLAALLKGEQTSFRRITDCRAATGIEVLREAHQRCLGTPFVLVSGTVGEQAELAGQNGFSFVHPEDLASARHSFTKPSKIILPPLETPRHAQVHNCRSNDRY